MISNNGMHPPVGTSVLQICMHMCACLCTKFTLLSLCTYFICHWTNMTNTLQNMTYKWQCYIGIWTQHSCICLPKHSQLKDLLHVLMPSMGQHQICLSICHIYRLGHVHIWHNYASIHTSYELATINNVTRNTAIHTLHIVGICPWTNMPPHCTYMSHCTTTVV